jgi:Galactose oxidase, central domain/Kelch motif
MKSLRTASGAVAVTLFALAASFGLNAADMPCDKNHYILDYPVTTPWIATGSLNVARTSHTATLLPDGRVLVAGGRALSNTGANVLLDSTELYDPVSGQWSVTGSLVKPRVLHTATLLANGQVLVVGGNTSPAPPNFGRDNTAEVYDPASGTWVLTGSMGTVRSGHTATLLQDGRVLVAGGFNTDDSVKTAELYDPATGAWTPTGDLNVARYGHTATLLPDGSVLIAKGSNDGDLASTLSSAERYDPTSGTWNLIDDPTDYSSVLHSATPLSDGRVLFTGGYPGNDGQDFGPRTLALSQFFDPVTDMWEMVGNLNEARDGHTATLLPDGKLLVAGGFDWNLRIYVRSTELYDPVSATWMTAASLGTARSGHTATLLPDGTVLVAGGETGLYGSITLESAERYGAPVADSCQ